MDFAIRSRYLDLIQSLHKLSIQFNFECRSFLDEPTLPTEELHEDESDGENADQNDNQRVCHDITYTLQAIGYSIAFKRSTESESEAGSFRARRRPSSK